VHYHVLPCKTQLPWRCWCSRNARFYMIALAHQCTCFTEHQVRSFSLKSVHYSSCQWWDLSRCMKICAQTCNWFISLLVSEQIRAMLCSWNSHLCRRVSLCPAQCELLFFSDSHEADEVPVWNAVLWWSTPETMPRCGIECIGHVLDRHPMSLRLRLLLGDACSCNQ